MSSWAKVGVKCVCITDAWESFSSGNGVPGPGKDEVFEVAAVTTIQGYDVIGLWGSPLGEYWEASGFRPVAYPKQSAETDVALFKHHLKTAPVKPVDA